MDILMVAAELGPYVNTGPGGVVAALAKALKQLGHDVTVALPRLDGFEAAGLMVSRRLTPLELGDGSQVMLLDAQLPSGVKLVLFDQKQCFSGDTPLAPDGDAEQLAERAGVLIKSVRALCDLRLKAQQGFDVVHLFDWVAAPVALTGIPSRVVLTITDATHQGSFPARSSDALGIPKERAGEARAGNRVNALKAGISGADVITTLSDAYARELCQDGHAGGLTRVLNDRADALFGVQLGIDYAIYNPATDASLVHRYDAEDPSGKRVCKTALLRALELELEPERPLLVFTGPVTRSAGGDWLVQAIPVLLQNELSLVIGGGGDEALTTKLASLVERYPDNLRVLPKPVGSQEEKRKLMSAADLCLIAARADHTAIELMLAQRYGAVPIAHAVGALQDNVIDADAELSTGTGFVFEEGSPKTLAAAVARAVAGYRKPRFNALRRRVMRLDVSWDRPARRFQQLYRS